MAARAAERATVAHWLPKFVNLNSLALSTHMTRLPQNTHGYHHLHDAPANTFPPHLVNSLVGARVPQLIGSVCRQQQQGDVRLACLHHRRQQVGNSCATAADHSRRATCTAQQQASWTHVQMFAALKGVARNIQKGQRGPWDRITGTKRTQ